MQGTILHFRQSRHRQKDNHILIQVDKVESREKAAELIGKKVNFKTESGKEIKGKIVSEHGNKGVVRAIFEKGLPGQSLTQKVNID